MPKLAPLLVALAWLTLVTSAEASRHALVIGNDSYKSVPVLRNARADARAIAVALENSGFRVRLRLDQDERSLRESIRNFKSELTDGDEAVFFFSGHGVQIGTANYLLPTDVRGVSEEQVKDEALPLQRVLDDMQDQRVRFSLVIVDACRDNPFPRSGRAIGGRGLAPTSVATGQMILFAAGTGQQALDTLGPNDKNSNGVFTRVMLDEMQKPGVPVHEVLRNVRTRVVELARGIGHEQVPAMYDQTLGDFYFVAANRHSAVNTAAPSPTQSAMLSPPRGSARETINPLKWNLPSAYPNSNFHTQNLIQFADDVQTATNGKLHINVHANSSLLKAVEIKRAVQNGQVQVGEFLMANFQNDWQVFGADSLPFFANGYDEAQKLYASQKPLLQKKFLDDGLTLLYAVPWPPQGLYSSRPIESVNDLKGIKWRAYSPATARIAELVGARPVAIMANELSNAMASGAIESYMSSSTTGFDTKTYEHLKYWYDVQAWLPKNAVIVNKRAFDALDNFTQDAVLSAAAKAEQRGWEASKTTHRDALEKLKAQGMQIITPSSQLKADMKMVGSVMLKEWLEKTGPEGVVLVNDFRNR